MFYILKDRVPVESSAEEWGAWLSRHMKERRAAKTVVGDVEVSTVFLGLDHSFDGLGMLVFETMSFGIMRDHDQITVRCRTWQEAELIHREVCNEVSREQ